MTRVLDVHVDGRFTNDDAVEVALAGRVVAARVGWLGGGFHQLRLADDVPAAAGDPVEVRLGPERAPGLVLDPDAPRHGPTNDLLVALTRQLRSLTDAA